MFPTDTMSQKNGGRILAVIAAFFSAIKIRPCQISIKIKIKIKSIWIKNKPFIFHSFLIINEFPKAPLFWLNRAGIQK